MNKKHIIGVMIVFFVGVAGLLFYFSNQDSDDVAVVQDEYNNGKGIDGERASGSDEQKQQDDCIHNKNNTESVFVHVCGKVKKPGVYEVGSNSRVVDAIKAAGGLTKDAAGDDINQALLLSDGQQVYIPSKKEVKSGAVSKSIAIQSDNENKNIESNVDNDHSKVDINSADKQGLMSIPGVGSVRADRILEYRKSNGKFSSIDDIKKVKGIKDGLFKKISEYITVN